MSDESALPLPIPVRYVLAAVAFVVGVVAALFAFGVVVGALRAFGGRL